MLITYNSLWQNWLQCLSSKAEKFLHLSCEGTGNAPVLCYLIFINIMVSQVVENQTRVSKISNLLACTSTSSEEICLYCTKRQRRAIKNRAFPVLEVNFQGLLWTKSFCEQFLLKNIKLEEQLLLKSLLVLVFFVKVYLVKMCPIFDRPPLAFGASYQSFLRVC